MAISSEELIKVLEKEIGYRQESGPSPAKRDTDFIREGLSVVSTLRADLTDKDARKKARALAGRIESKPLRGRRLD